MAEVQWVVPYHLLAHLPNGHVSMLKDMFPDSMPHFVSTLQPSRYILASSRLRRERGRWQASAVVENREVEDRIYRAS